MANKILSIPGAKRTINALRDFGYDLNSAVADIIDNSISRGGAKNIYIDFNKDKKSKFHLAILDDGTGMSSSVLGEAMRIGSSNDDYGKGDLSKYGMGMKTASMSQSSLITVLSKKKGNYQCGYTWDLNHVDKTDKWEIFKLDSAEINKAKNKLTVLNLKNQEKILSKDSWTVVFWENLINFQANYNQYSSEVTSENYFDRTHDKLKIYLRLVFHRFISGENNLNKTNIFVNNKKLTGLDPFCKDEPHTYEMPINEKNRRFIIGDNSAPILIKPYILPTIPTKPGKYKFSSEDSWKEAANTLSWNEAQGYYVYRNNRLINWGGWQRTRAIDEHDKLARVSIDLTEEHDNLFTIDVKKTRIQFPEELRNHLKDNINIKLISEAKKRYAGGEKKENNISNVVRENTKKVSHLASSLIKADSITVIESKSKKGLIIKNKYGQKISEDMTYKMLDAGKKIVSKSFGDSSQLWKMAPNPYNEFQVLVNIDHPFYDLVYGDAEKNKKITAIMDAFLFTMSFVELKCITNNNELLFEQMREVASTVLNKFIEDKIL